ncbi:hypothetical protein Tco_0853859 [Tanacetum coccineum]
MRNLGRSNDGKLGYVDTEVPKYINKKSGQWQSKAGKMKRNSKEAKTNSACNSFKEKGRIGALTDQPDFGSGHLYYPIDFFIYGLPQDTQFIYGLQDHVVPFKFHALQHLLYSPATNPGYPGRLVARDTFPGRHVARDKWNGIARMGFLPGRHSRATSPGPHSFSQTIKCHGGRGMATRVDAHELYLIVDCVQFLSELGRCKYAGASN